MWNMNEIWKWRHCRRRSAGLCRYWPPTQAEIRLVCVCVCVRMAGRCGKCHPPIHPCRPLWNRSGLKMRWKWPRKYVPYVAHGGAAPECTSPPDQPSSSSSSFRPAIVSSIPGNPKPCHGLRSPPRRSSMIGRRLSCSGFIMKFARFFQQEHREEYYYRWFHRIICWELTQVACWIAIGGDINPHQCRHDRHQVAFNSNLYQFFFPPFFPHFFTRASRGILPTLILSILIRFIAKLHGEIAVWNVAVTSASVSSPRIQLNSITFNSIQSIRPMFFKSIIRNIPNMDFTFYYPNNFHYLIVKLPVLIHGQHKRAQRQRVQNQIQLNRVIQPVG